MRGGFSGARGFMLYDTQSDLAVYGYYENEDKIIKVGSVDEMKRLSSDHDNECKKSDKGYNRIMGRVLLVMIGMIVVSKIFGSFLLFLSVLVFCVLSYFAWLVILFAWHNSYKDETTYMQFRRYHGAEHSAIRLVFKNREVTLENLKKLPYFDEECGTAYAGTWVVLSFIIAVLIYHCVEIGFLKALLYLLIGVVVLILNIFNPYNPFKLIQYKAVAKPTDKEYDLALMIVEEFYRLHEKT